MTDNRNLLTLEERRAIIRRNASVARGYAGERYVMASRPIKRPWWYTPAWCSLIGGLMFLMMWIAGGKVC